MLAYLGRLLRAGRQPVRVRYLSKANGTPEWKEGWLLAVDTQGAAFGIDPQQGAVECLPWGSIGGLTITPGAGAGDEQTEQDAPAFFRNGAQ
jgi:hypothetical protein